MSAAVAQLLAEALLLPGDSRTELVEAILEHSEPTPAFLEEQLSVIGQRMENVRTGSSRLIPAGEAHERVLQSLKTRQA